jgi:hypothetical protein
MSLLIIPQMSNKYNDWKPEFVNRPNFIESLYKLVEKKTLIMEICEYYNKNSFFSCIKFTSNTGTNPNVIFKKLKGPVVYYKKTDSMKMKKHTCWIKLKVKQIMSYY